ncbi:hypothetical protein DRP07_02185 [Archaeoglobales archaeon]|nr:MAG: hypothetical protein DRP07_02185 [Archaeoglobales archaeon]
MIPLLYPNFDAEDLEVKEKPPCLNCEHYSDCNTFEKWRTCAVLINYLQFSEMNLKISKGRLEKELEKIKKVMEKRK